MLDQNFITTLIAASDADNETPLNVPAKAATGFATASATLLNLNLSASVTVHWAVSYFDEA